MKGRAFQSRSERKENIAHVQRKKKLPVPDRKTYEKEIRTYFDRRLRNLKVIKTTRTPSGQILDWVEIDSQVAGRKIASPPPTPVPIVHARGKLRDRVVEFELEDKQVEHGPTGTIPILRKDLSKMLFSTSLKDHLSKHGHKSYTMVLNNDQSLEVPGDGDHDYAYTGHNTTCYGGDGYFSAYDPYLQWPNEFSLLQILLTRGSGTGKQTIEAGWQEFRNLYGDWVPHLFVFYTTNGYSSSGDNVGGYNQDVDGWVQYSDSIYPGAISSPNSVRGGTQYVMQIKYQLYQGNWWLCCNGIWIGYYPASLFSNSGLHSHADRIAFYGEIVDSSDHVGLTHTDMGSGYWPEYRWPWAAYMRSLRYQSGVGGSMSQYNADTTFATDPNLYDLETHMNSGSTWGSYLWLGGPGGG